MPHDPDVRVTSHDRHDPMLVAALAAGDLAGTDRDQALALIRSCSDCAVLHDDLLALARATAAAPPPIATRPRDFFLTPADAARLRPSAWRRLIAALAAPRAAVTRPLGVGLATLGLVGLLIGNVQLGFGSASTAIPAADGVGAAASAASGKAALEGASSGGDRSSHDQVDAAAPAGSQVPPYASGENFGASTASSAPRSAAGGNPAPVTAFGAGSARGSEGPAQQTTRELTDASTATPEPTRPWNLLFGAAVVAGIGLLVVSRVSGRPAR